MGHPVQSAVGPRMRGRIVRSMLGVLALFFATGHGAAQAAVWISHGPEGGAVSALVVDPTSPSTLYAGTTSGVFKTTTGGTRWAPVNSALTSFVQAFAIDPTSPSTLYAGTTSG